MSDVNKRRELVVYGFIRGILRPKKIPIDIKKLCLSFYPLIEWEKKLHGNAMSITDNGVCVVMKSRTWGSAFLTGEHSQGTHHWKFKIEHGPESNHYFLIGIWKTKSAEHPILNRYFTDKVNNGYSYDAQYGRFTTPSSPGTGGPAYAVKCHKDDVIDMYLNFDKLMLSFAVNGTYYPNGQKIEKTEYKAAITMHGIGDKLRFISYDWSKPPTAWNDKGTWVQLIPSKHVFSTKPRRF